MGKTKYTMAAMFFAVFLAACTSIVAQRDYGVVQLNDGWTADGQSVVLPHCWNVEDGTDGPTDMKSDNRREGGRDGLNDKGLVGFDHKTKKPVYDFYRKEWCQ